LRLLSTVFPRNTIDWISAFRLGCFVAHLPSVCDRLEVVVVVLVGIQRDGAHVRNSSEIEVVNFKILFIFQGLRYFYEMVVHALIYCLSNMVLYEKYFFQISCGVIY
jgi:hypothetical protein